jgi:polygalacturonase
MVAAALSSAVALLPLLALAISTCAAAPAPSTSIFGGRAGPTFNLTQFGGVPDNATLNTKAFEAGVAAVAKAVADGAAGGTLVVPPGAWRTGPLNLTSHMTLYISGEATIYGPTYTQLGAGPAFDMWPIIPPMPSYGQGRDHKGPRRAAFIGGVGLTDVKVTAAESAWGTIDGAGAPWWACHCGSKEARARADMAPGVAYDAEARTESGGCSSSWAQQYPCKGPGKEEVTRGHLIEFAHSSDIEISNLQLRNSPFWTVHPFDCHGVTVRNIDIWAPAHSPNTDGVDPDSSTNVLIENFRYHGGDDVIAIKSGWDCFGYHYNHSTRDVVIRNVTAVYSEAAGCAIGSEMSGGMKNITVSDCDFTQTETGLNIKYSEYRGGYVEDIHYRNIIMGNQGRAALTVNSNYGSKNPSCPNPHKGRRAPPVPCPVNTITYTNITSAPGTTVKAWIDFEGLPTNTIEGVSIHGVRLNGEKSTTCKLVKGTYSDCAACSSCEGLKPATV